MLGRNYERLQQMYSENEYYWGREPNEFAKQGMKFLPRQPGNRRLRAVDIGAGEGRDAVFFAERGLDLLAVDAAPNGLEKANRLAEEKGVNLSTEQADINSLSLTRKFDLVYSTGALQYLLPANRTKRLRYFQEHTTPGGIHALFVFVDHVDLPIAPDWGDDECLYAPGELSGYYGGWKRLHSRRFVFDDDSGGTVHQHAAEEYVFKKP